MNRVFYFQFALELVVVAAVCAVLPRLSRRGLLFGVHVGSAGSASAEARAVTVRWYRSMALVLTASGLLFAAAVLAGWTPGLAFLASSLLLLPGMIFTYFWCHFAARRLGVENVSPAVAVLDDGPRAGTTFPLVTLALVLLAVAGMVAYGLSRYAEMPARIPIHFDLAGQPDGWADRSPIQVLLLPAIALALGSFLGLMAWMLLSAKRGLRHPGTAASAEAARRFRVAVSRFLCGITLASTAMFVAIHVAQIRSALGLQVSIGPLAFGIMAGMTLLSLSGMVFLMARYGQAGARIEEARGAVGELTDGLADNRLWKWGAFYVNREDPSIFVEKRFGLGYTINLGNPKAIALFAGFFLVLSALVVVALVTA